MGGICGVWKIPSRKVISSDEQLFGQEYWRGEGPGRNVCTGSVVDWVIG